MVNYLVNANPKGPWVADMDGYLPLHWAVNQDIPNIGKQSYRRSNSHTIGANYLHVWRSTCTDDIDEDQDKMRMMVIIIIIIMMMRKRRR